MTSLRGYATAQNVRDFLGGQVNTYLTDAMIDVMISDVEGVVDGWLKIGSQSGANSFTISTSKSPHLIVRRAVIAGTAILVLGSSSLSWQTLEQAVNCRDIATYYWETYYKLITGDQKPTGIADFILSE